MNYRLVLISIILVFVFTVNAQNTSDNIFKKLKEELVTPDVYTRASGEPCHEYYQQKENYKINVVLDDAKQTISGEKTLTYFNNSSDKLDYLWVQLDQNMCVKDSDTK